MRRHQIAAPANDQADQAPQAQAAAPAPAPAPPAPLAPQIPAPAPAPAPAPLAPAPLAPVPAPAPALAAPQIAPAAAPAAQLGVLNVPFRFKMKVMDFLSATDVDSWIAITRSTCQAANVNVNDIAHLIPAAMTKDTTVMMWFTTCGWQPADGTEAFFAKIRARFSDVDPQASAANKLATLQQSAITSVSVYADQLKSLAQKAGRAEDSLVGDFIRGLLPALKFELLKLPRAQNLDNAIRQALLLEAAQQQIQLELSAPINALHFSNYMFNPALAHQLQLQQNAAAALAPAPPPVVVNAVEAPRAAPRREEPAAPRQQNAADNIYCNFCFRVGHVALDCNNRVEAQQRREAQAERLQQNSYGNRGGRNGGRGGRGGGGGGGQRQPQQQQQAPQQPAQRQAPAAPRAPQQQPQQAQQPRANPPQQRAVNAVAPEASDEDQGGEMWA